MLISYPYYEEDRPIHQAYGVYEVVQEVEFLERAALDNSYPYPGAFVIRGQLLKGLSQKWITIPNITRYYASAYSRQSVVPAKSEEAFQQLLETFRRYCRPDIDLAPLISEPTNEQEVVVLFSANVEKFGYKSIKRCQRRFPDAVVTNTAGNDEYIEFKYYASSYDYPSQYDGNVVKCVCWIDDREPGQKTKRGLRVIELQQELSGKKGNSTC